MNKNIKASSWYLIGNLFDKAIAFLTIPIFTRMLTTTEYGIVNTYISYVTILTIVLGLSMEVSVQTAYFEFKEDMESYASTIAIGAGAFTLIFSAAVVVGIHILNIQVPWIMIVLAILQGFMTYVTNIAKMYYMMQVSYIKRVILMSVPHTLIAFLSVWGISLCQTEKYMGRIVPYALVMTAFGVAILIGFIRKAKCKFSKTYFHYAISYSLPIIFHALSLQILAQFDKIMITSMRSAAETGVYSLIYNVGLVSQVFTNAFDNAWLPWFQKKMYQGGQEKTVNKNAGRLMMIVAVLVAGIILVAPEVIKILATQEYWSGIPMVVPIILATFTMFMYTLEVHTEYCYKRTKQIPIYTMIAALSNLILNYIFIPKYGATAAAYTTLVAYIVSFVLHYYAAHKCNKDVLPFQIFVFPIIVALVASAFMQVFLNAWICRWIVAVILGVLFLVYAYKNKLLRTMLAD